MGIEWIFVGKMVLVASNATNFNKMAILGGCRVGFMG